MDDFLNVRWYAKPDDLIGGWCVMPVDQTPGEAGNVPQMADFCTEAAAQHIADLHNATLEPAELWEVENLRGKEILGAYVKREDALEDARYVASKLSNDAVEEEGVKAGSVWFRTWMYGELLVVVRPIGLVHGRLPGLVRE